MLMIAAAGFDSSFEITALSTVDIYSAAANGDNTGFVIASCTDIKLTALIAKYFYLPEIACFQCRSSWSAAPSFLLKLPPRKVILACSLMSLAGSPLAKNILPLL